MRVVAYYNENDPFCAQWLRNLIEAGYIAPGEVDERDIRDVKPEELNSYKQCHFFAGIGVWSYALRRAGWSDDEPVWTGSCPCQPFSAGGRKGGFADERHLWPAWFHLIEVCRPGVVFGEQVASKDGLAWLDLVQADLQGAGYAVGGVDFCAAGVGAPHVRQRLWFVGESTEPRLEGRSGSKREELRSNGQVDSRGPSGELADADRGKRNRVASSEGRQHNRSASRRDEGNGEPERCSPLGGFWSDAGWIECRDGKARPIEPGTFPLAHGAPARVGRLRAYGNAIVPPVAEEVIRAYMEIQP